MNIAQGVAIGTAGTVVGQVAGGTIAGVTSLTRDALKQQGTAGDRVWTINIDGVSGAYSINMQ